MGTLTAVVLAAGAGRRFGGPKALVRFRGRPLLDRAVALADAAGCEECLVVLGADAESIAARANVRAASVVVAPDWADGMGASLRVGLDEAVRRGPRDVVVLLVDQPLIGPDAVIRLRRALDGGAAVAVASYDGQARNPVAFSASVLADVARAVGGDRGARDWLHAHPELVTEVECADTGDPSDIDTVDDLNRLS
ncbi:MAG TPA: nucleotidyltransferase family protein [Mycobacteriales bacterium]|nr:nucleotidyltransferase family protein [Mycobacteriales bacterium]